MHIMYNIFMKKVNFNVKKEIVTQFILKLNKKLGSFYIDITSLGFLSKRKIYKLLKLSFQSEGKDFVKSELNSIALFLSNSDFLSSSKTNIRRVYKELKKTDIYSLINSIDDIYQLLELLLKYKSILETKTPKETKNPFEQMRVLLI